MRIQNESRRTLVRVFNIGTQILMGEVIHIIFYKDHTVINDGIQRAFSDFRYDFRIKLITFVRGKYNMRQKMGHDGSDVLKSLQITT